MKPNIRLYIITYSSTKLNYQPETKLKQVYGMNGMLFKDGELTIGRNFEPKIIYNDIAQTLSFALSKDGEFLNNTAYFFGSYDISLLSYLQAVLNSDLIDWYYRTISVQLGEKAVRMFSIYVLKIPIPKKIVKIDNEDAIYKIYGLNDQEVNFLKTDTVSKSVSELR